MTDGVFQFDCECGQTMTVNRVHDLGLLIAHPGVTVTCNACEEEWDFEAIAVRA